jgi:hypothetical protein
MQGDTGTGDVIVITHGSADPDAFLSEVLVIKRTV